MHTPPPLRSAARWCDPFPSTIAVLGLLLGPLTTACGDAPSSPDDTPLAPPTSSAVRELNSGDLELTWRDNSANELRFEVVRSSAGPSGAYTGLASVGAGTEAYLDAGVDGVSEYCYQVRAVGPAGTTPSAFTSAVCHQSLPPSAPSELAAEATLAQIDLAWVDNSDDEAGFEVWRSTTGADGAFELTAAVMADATSYGNTGLQEDVEYCYRVRALGAKGQPSAYSSAVCATTPVPALPPPAAPGDLTATVTGATVISLGWTDRASNEAGFEVWRSTAGPSGAYALLAELGPDVTATDDLGLSPGEQYCYQVRAAGAATAPPSAFSGSECATAPSPPAQPTGLTATPSASTRIELAWQDQATDEAEYQIWRSTTGSSGTYSRVATEPADAGVYSDAGLTQDTEYCYEVRAGGAGFAPNSPFTAPACATTPVPLVVRIVLFGDSNTDRCEEVQPPNRISSYVSVTPRLAPTDPPLSCSVPGKVRASWNRDRTETIRVVNHAIASTTTGGGAFGGPDRSNQGAPNARLKVGGFTRFEGEVLGKGYPWSGGEPTNSSFPTGPVSRVNAFTPGPDDFVYVSMGTNDDAGAGRTMTAAETDANLHWMVEQWTAAGHAPDHFILTTLAPRDDANSPVSIPDRNALIQALAIETGVYLVDLAAHTSDDNGATWRSPSLNIGDGIHYTVAVRAWLGDQVAAHMSAVTPARP